uniref:Uncharacterized protein n=1 Tax=Klebsiella pneumoniae TaxID=573 RepID=A0A8B0SYJ6_KLEPN|nr:hypothetical protein [Klebsiella pneumoniae]
MKLLTAGITIPFFMRGSDNSHTQRMLRTFFSTAAVTRKRDISPPGLRLIIPVTVGEPSVSVPVLSTTSVSTFFQDAQGLRHS